MMTGGDKLQAHLDKILVRISGAQSVRVGFLEGTTYPDGTSVAMVAAVNEFGNPGHNQPPRPFFRNMIDADAPAWGKVAAQALKGADYDAALALGRMGEFIKSELQDSIRGFNSVPLSPRTIAAKGGVKKQLIDTGHMLNSVDYEVK